MQNLKKIRFKTKEAEEVYFNADGDPAAKYDIINWQPKKDGTVEFVTVGLYDASLPEDKQLNLYNLTLTWANNSKQVKVFFQLNNYQHRPWTMFKHHFICNLNYN